MQTSLPMHSRLVPSTLQAKGTEAFVPKHRSIVHIWGLFFVYDDVRRAMGIVLDGGSGPHFVALW